MGSMAPQQFLAPAGGGRQEIELQKLGFVIGSNRLDRTRTFRDGIVDVLTPLYEEVSFTIRDNSVGLNPKFPSQADRPSKDNWALATVQIWDDGTLATPEVEILLEKWET